MLKDIQISFSLRDAWQYLSMDVFGMDTIVEIHARKIIPNIGW